MPSALFKAPALFRAPPESKLQPALFTAPARSGGGLNIAEASHSVGNGVPKWVGVRCGVHGSSGGLISVEDSHSVSDDVPKVVCGGVCGEVSMAAVVVGSIPLRIPKVLAMVCRKW